MLGFLSPSSRGSLSTAMLIFFIGFSSVAGYYSSQYYRAMGGEKWRLNAIMTAVLVPG
jgi:transmembrane 9 superfamily protein 2/4